MFTIRAFSLALGLGSGLIQMCAGLSTGSFIWPELTQQCVTYNLTIFDGVPPWTMVMAPIDGEPIYWDITAPARYDGTKSVTANVCAYTALAIPLQIPAGTPYTVFMMDSTGYFTGLNPTEIQMSGSGPTSNCLDSVVTRTRDFTFTVAGSTAMCEDNFEISWVDTLGTGPYNFTVLPLDSSTSPWDQPLSGGGTTTGASGWNVNMTTGTRFTIMMNNAEGYGRGGVGGVYQVAEGSSNSCIIAPMYTTAAWPGSVQTTSLLTAAALPTSLITSRLEIASTTVSDLGGYDGYSDIASSSRSFAPPVTVVVTESSKSGLSTGATAGIGAGVGVIALGAVIAGVLFWLRKRKRTQGVVNSYARPVDLNEDGGHGGLGRPPMSAVEPKVEPYPSPEMTGLSQAPQMPYGSNLAPSSTGHEAYGVAGVAALGSQQHQSRTSMAYSDSQMSPTGNDASNRYSMASHAPQNQTSPYFPPTGQAGPLPSKTSLARQSYQPSQQSYQGPPGGLAPQSPGAGSVSGSSSSGRPLPGPPMQSMSESGTNDTKTDMPEHSHAGSQGHNGNTSPITSEPVFNIHRDAEAEPAPQGGMIDLPPMYHDVPQRRDGAPESPRTAQ